MVRKLDEQTVKNIHAMLVEKFGEPIGTSADAGEGVADERNERPVKGKKLKNRGFGSKLAEDITQGDVNLATCDDCGAPMSQQSTNCGACGMMSEHLIESEGGGRHPGHASSCTCPDCSRPEATDEGYLDEEDLDQKAPPGREKQVKTLKKAKSVDNPYAVAWASYNKKR